MCGLIAAFTCHEGAFMPEDLTAPLQVMKRRGPDAEGFWADKGALMGHKRLAILDLDARSHQPMLSVDGRYAIVFNGEIYNFRDLRRELEQQGEKFRTTSDTEVLLALFARDGDRMLSRLRGMFAFVIWDRIAQRGFVARDPYGIKPLYYSQSAEGVLLASQVKALLATGRVSHAPDPRGQAGFWMLGSVPEPYSWYRDIRSLPAGHFAWVEGGRLSSTVCWWDIGLAWRRAEREGSDMRPDELQHRVREALTASVAAHLVSDVPVGVFLSGGIDSGALAGLMASAGGPLQGFTLSFGEYAGRREDEAPVAASVASHFGIAHHVRQVTREEFDRDLPRILGAMDQPSVDGVNTWYASKAVAERGLKVVVSGVGGDELFQGYSSFRQLPPLVSAWGALSHVPMAKALARAVGSVQARRTRNARWEYLPYWFRTVRGAWWARRGLFAPSDLGNLMGEDLAAEALEGFEADAWVESMSGCLPSNKRLALAQIESMTYLRNQLLRDSDWASMDHSVELRTPLVDAWLLRDLEPVLARVGEFPNKGLLANAPTPPLPREVMQRAKTGFGIPVGIWAGSRQATDGSPAGTRSWALRLAAAYSQGSGPTYPDMNRRTS